MLNHTVFSAKRLSLMNYEINSEQSLVASINLSNRIWPTEGAALDSILSKALTDYPCLTVDGLNYTAHRKLLTDNFMSNEFKIWLVDSEGKERICAYTPGKKGKFPVEYNGKTYFLKRESLFTFRFILSSDDSQKVSFKEVTSFFVVTSKRDFQIDTTEAIDHLLLCFAFFLATSIFYK